MRLNLSAKENAPALLRKAGYHKEFNRKTGEESFIRSVDGNHFPRFHIYVKETPANSEINLHLDQKKPVYEGVSAHAGEYAGEVVESEMKRIQTFIGRPNKPAIKISDDFLG